MPLDHPLTDEHCNCLDRVLDSVPKALELARACTDCGWDVSDQIRILEEQLRMAQKAKQTFFPNRP